MTHRRTAPRRATRLLPLLAAAGLLPGCVLDDDPGEASAERGQQVRVVDNDFEPAHLEVDVGEEVTWTWDGRIGHDVVGDDFDSGVQQEGTFTHTFGEVGVHDYECTLHPGMTGRVTVVEP